MKSLFKNAFLVEVKQKNGHLKLKLNGLLKSWIEENLVYSKLACDAFISLL